MAAIKYKDSNDQWQAIVNYNVTVPTVVLTTGSSIIDVMSQDAVTDALDTKANSADLATVATTGSYDDLTDKPTIPTVPTNISAFINDAGYLTQHQDISGKADISSLATVATTGSYDDLTNKPTIPIIPSDYVNFTSDQTITGAKTFKGVDRIILQGNNASDKPGFAINDSSGKKMGFLEYRGGDNMMILGVDNSAQKGNNTLKVGFRDFGSYSYNATIPIGINKNTTFGSGDVVIPIAVNGTKAGTDGNILISIPAAQVNSDWNAASGVALILNKPTIPTIPTNVSDFTNDAGYVTSSDFDNIGTATIISIVDAAIAEASKDESIISFDTDTASVNTGETLTKTVTVTAGDGAVTYSSSDTDVATVNNNGVVTGVSAGTCTITASIASTSTYRAAIASYTLTVIHYDPYGGHDYVEIGGLKWATMNIGASSITECGLYFAWGETQGYTTNQIGTGDQLRKFSWGEYKYCNGTYLTITKYNSNDGKTVLESSDDAATVNWNDKWRTPTQKECQDFINAVNVVWTDNYNNTGVSGMVCTVKTDSSKILFLPDAGYYLNGNRVNNSNILIWTRNRSIYDGQYCALTMTSVNKTELYAERYLYSSRSCGVPIRPVAD